MTDEMYAYFSKSFAYGIAPLQLIYFVSNRFNVSQEFAADMLVEFLDRKEAELNEQTGISN